MNRNTWIFFAYKQKEDHPRSPYFYKLFYRHARLKEFSAKHSFLEKSKYNDYCSDYFTFKKEEEQK